MNTTIVASLIGTLGAAFVTVLVYFLQSLRDGIRAASDRIDNLGSGLESRLGTRIDGVGSGLESRLGGRIDKVESRLGGRIDKVESRLGGRIDKVESRLTGIAGKLTRIEATQEEHGRLLVSMADHGERIAALEGAVATLS